MPYNFDLDKLSIELGISTERLSKNIATYGAMSELFPILEVGGCEVGLFGGTALNKIYFGKLQRLSYDLDIFASSRDKTIEVLKNAGAKMKFAGNMPVNKKSPSTRLEYKEIVIDLVEAKKGGEKPSKIQAYDLLYYYGQLVPPVVVPSYSLEYLLASKTTALLDRNELRDIYDTWMGLKLIKDIPKYAKYLKTAAKERGVKDIVTYADYSIHNMLLNIEYYGKKQIEVTNRVSPSIMLKDIKAFLDTRI